MAIRKKDPVKYVFSGKKILAVLAILAILASAAALLMGNVQLPTFGNDNVDNPQGFVTKEDLKTALQSNQPKTNDTPVVITVGDKQTPIANTGIDSTENTASPLTTQVFEKAHWTKDFAESMDYQGETYTLQWNGRTSARQATEEWLGPAFKADRDNNWKSTNAPVQVNSAFVSRLNENRVLYYATEPDDEGKVNIIVPYMRTTDELTKFMPISKNELNALNFDRAFKLTEISTPAPSDQTNSQTETGAAKGYQQVTGGSQNPGAPKATSSATQTHGYQRVTP